MALRCVPINWVRPLRVTRPLYSTTRASLSLFPSNSYRFAFRPPARTSSNISSRKPETPVTQKVRVHENIYTLPNILTGTRLIAAPTVGYLILNGHLKYALGLFAYAGITDLVDGWIARRYKLQTVVGSVIDPMADKLLMTIVTVTLAVKGLLPAYLATLILGRDVSLAIAALYYRYASLPAPKTMARYWDFSLPSAEVHPTTVSKANTFLQLVLVGSTLALPVVATNVDIGTVSAESLGQALGYFQYLVAGTTIWSGASYAFLKNAVHILGPDEAVKVRQGQIGRAIIGVTFGGVLATATWLALEGETKPERDADAA